MSVEGRIIELEKLNFKNVVFGSIVIIIFSNYCFEVEQFEPARNKITETCPWSVQNTLS